MEIAGLDHGQVARRPVTIDNIPDMVNPAGPNLMLGPECAIGIGRRPGGPCVECR